MPLKGKHQTTSVPVIERDPRGHSIVWIRHRDLQIAKQTLACTTCGIVPLMVGSSAQGGVTLTNLTRGVSRGASAPQPSSACLATKAARLKDTKCTALTSFLHSAT